jgi:putative tricarboxylic transport membrane protein
MGQEALKLKFYTALGPGPGFFPFWLVLILAGLSAIQLYHATFRKSDPLPDDFFASRSGYLKALAVLVALFGSVFAMDPLGFRVTMLVFMLWLSITLGEHKLTSLAMYVPISLVVSFGGFYLFNTILKVPLPVGMFGI